MNKSMIMTEPMYDFEVYENIVAFNTPKYFVAARGIDGSRHYSKATLNYDDALKTYEDYKGYLRYLFKGGEVCLYGEQYEDIEVIKSDWI